MADLQLRFNKDMLVLSSPLDTMLERQGIETSRDRQYLNLMEPDAIRDAFQLEVMAGAQCIVTTTEDITQARLAHVNMDGDASQLAKAAVAVANSAKPQHVLVEIGPCGLPLDASSQASLKENRNQYANAARTFHGCTFDAFFLTGFSSINDLKCALMGLALASDKPVLASVSVGKSTQPNNGEAIQSPREPANPDDLKPNLPLASLRLAEQASPPPLPLAKRTLLAPERWPEAIEVMVDLGASVVGYETADTIDKAVEYARIAASTTDLPILAQLKAAQPQSAHATRNLTPLDAITDYTPDTMATAAVRLYGAGVQFLRATGAATPAFTGALAATVQGLDVHRG